jgi:hypothetical protein
LARWDGPSAPVFNPLSSLAAIRHHSRDARYFVHEGFSMTQQNPVAVANWAAGTARDAQAAAGQALAKAQGHDKAYEQLDKRVTELAQRTSVTRSGSGGPPNIQYIENIPGRRVPFDLLVNIFIGAGVNTVQQQSILVSQEGPFVAVSRVATFISQLQLQRIDPDTQAKANFFGRSYGRQRPIHSAWDLMDGMPRQQVLQSEAFPGTGSPHILSPSNGSPFRTMESDYTIQFLNAGSSFPRSNIQVPSAFWTPQINAPFELGALDVFERGETLTFNVQPLHVNNPSYGNIQGFAAGGAGSFPFLASGWDYIEGINDEAIASAGATDPITRLPDGILCIGFHGYRIIQPAGSGPY